MNATDWHNYQAASLNPTQAFNEAAPQSAGGISACNSNPAVPPWQGTCGERRSRFFIPDVVPTQFDRDLAVSVFVILFGITPILFVYAVIKLFE